MIIPLVRLIIIITNDPAKSLNNSMVTFIATLVQVDGDKNETRVGTMYDRIASARAPGQCLTLGSTC